MNLNKRYQQPRKPQQDNNVFDDKRTGRKVYNNYTGTTIDMKNPFSKMPVITRRMYLKGTSS